jgi:hypothetical protein
MPLLDVYTSKTRPPNADQLLKSLSVLLARELKKPESYVMTALHAEVPMTFAGTSEPSCFASLKSIGSFALADSERLSAVLCGALSEGLSVPKNHIYLEFSNPPGHLRATRTTGDGSKRTGGTPLKSGGSRISHGNAWCRTKVSGSITSCSA